MDKKFKGGRILILIGIIVSLIPFMFLIGIPIHVVGSVMIMASEANLKQKTLWIILSFMVLLLMIKLIEMIDRFF